MTDAHLTDEPDSKSLPHHRLWQPTTARWLILGIIALWALSLPAITTLPMMPKAIGGMRWKRSQRMGYVCLILVVAHMVALGVRGWLSPEHWPWMLPPISLVAAIIAMIPLVVKFLK
jgi:DMSO/TMAO reductase YedYZ heme-binding membrane subunit